jgi:hypothetical protein
MAPLPAGPIHQKPLSLPCRLFIMFVPDCGCDFCYLSSGDKPVRVLRPWAVPQEVASQTTNAIYSGWVHTSSKRDYSISFICGHPGITREIAKNEMQWRDHLHFLPVLWSSGQCSWLLIQRFRVRFLALPDFLSSSGSGTGSTQPLWG